MSLSIIVTVTATAVSCSAINDLTVELLLYLVLRPIMPSGGPTGVELTAELGDFVRYDVATFFPHLKHRIQITLMEATGQVLGMFDPAVSSYATSVLRENGAVIHSNAMVTQVDAERIQYKTKAPEGEMTMRNMEYGTVVWAGGINTRPLTKHIITEVNNLNMSHQSRMQEGEDGDRVSKQTLSDPSNSPLQLKPVQWSPRGIVVDDKFRVKGLAGRSDVFALGDCALVAGCSPTAQAAYQQGKYLGRLLRDTHNMGSSDETICIDTNMTEMVALKKKSIQKDTMAIDRYKQFQFHNYGALAYVGTSKGVAELKTVLWNNPLEILKGWTQEEDNAESLATTDANKKNPASSSSASSTTVVEGGSAFVIWRSLYFSKLLSQRNKAQVAFDWLKTGVFGRDIASPYDIPSLKRSGDAAAGSSDDGVGGTKTR